MVIYTYLPKELLPESFEDLTFEEFFELYGQADCAREMRIEDIETGVAKGIEKPHSRKLWDLIHLYGLVRNSISHFK